MAEPLEPRILHAADLAGALTGDLAGAIVASSTTQRDTLELRSTELVVVDGRLGSAAAARVAALEAGFDDGHHVQRLTLGEGDDALARIDAVLRGRDDIASLHLLPWAQDGAARLGATTLDDATWLQHAATVAGWGDLLAPGRALTLDAEPASRQALAALTGHDVVDAPASDPQAALQAALLTQPIAFERNVGQADASIDHFARGAGWEVHLADGQARVALAHDGGVDELRVRLVDARGGIAGRGESPLPGTVSYLTAQSASNVIGLAQHAAVRYDGVWDGIDVRWHGAQGRLEYDFIVNPGASVDTIALRMDGADRVHLDAAGALVLGFDDGHGSERQVRFEAPVAWQDGADGRTAVASRYVLHDDGRIGFVVGAHDATRVLVIDPVLAYGSYLGDAQADTGRAVAHGADGSVFLLGTTYNSGLLGLLANGGDEVMVTKLDAAYNRVYTTYAGGSVDEEAGAIVIGSDGLPIIAATSGNATGLLQVDAPTTGGAYQTGHDGGKDAWVFKLDAGGTALVWSTLLGGGADDVAHAVALDSAGDVYVGGSTLAANFDTTGGAYQAAALGGVDGWVAKLSGDGRNLVYATRLGGVGSDVVHALAVDGDGQVVAVGTTQSSDFATTSDAVDRTVAGEEGFVVQLSNTGTSLRYATVLGGSSVDRLYAVALDAQGRFHVAGETYSADFPLTAGAHQSALRGYDAVYAVIDPSRSGSDGLAYSTLWGGSSADTAQALVRDGQGGVFLAGRTLSTDLPVTAGAPQAAMGGGQDGFVVRFDEVSGAPTDATYLGGSADEEAPGIAWYRGKVVVIGTTTSSSGVTTAGGDDRSYGGSGDGFVAAYDFRVVPVVTPSGVPLTHDEGDTAQRIDGSLALTSSTGLASGATVRITGLYVQGEDVLAFDNANAWGITGSWDAATGTLTLTGSASAASWQAALRSVTYDNGSQRPTQGQRTILVVLDNEIGPSNPGLIELWVEPDNDAPTLVAPTSLTVVEHQVQTFSAAGGNAITLADVDAANELLKLRLQASVGTLTIGSSAGIGFVTGTGIAEAEFTIEGTVTALNAALDGLAWQAPTGPASATLTLAVDDPGMAGGSGSPARQVSGQVQLLVTGPNDAPTIADGTVVPLAGTDEDTISPAPSVTSLLAGATWADADLGALQGLAVTGTTGAGVWQYSVGGSTWTDFGSVGTTNALLLDDSARVRYVPDGRDGETATFTFQAWDRTSGTASGDGTPSKAAIPATGGTAAWSVGAATASLLVSPVNDAPAGTSTTVTIDEDTPRTLAAGDFGHVDAVEGHALAEVVISALPATGQLRLDGVAVTAGQAVSAADLARGALVYTPPADGHGNALASLGFQVRDTGGTSGGGVDTDPVTRTLTFDVRSVSDAPVGRDATVTLLEDTARILGTADFGYADVADGNLLLGVVLDSVPAAGGLTLDGVAVSAGQTIAAADLARGALVYAPAADAAGAAQASLAFRVRDDGGVARGGQDTDATARTLTFDVQAVNDAPSGQAATLAIDEDTPRVLTAADFGFRDDADGHQLAAVVIVGTPAAGQLTLDGIAVTAGQSISAADLARGALRYTPPTDAHGPALSSTTFRVRDDGGTADGGLDLDPTARLLTFDVQSVPDAPTGQDATITIAEDTARTLTAADFGFGDAADGDALSAVIVDTVPAVGRLALDGVTVAAGQSISAADLARGALVLLPPAEGHGTALVAFTFRLRDDGGTALGGADTDGTARTLRVDVLPVNDAPTGRDSTLAIDEDVPRALTAADFGFDDTVDGDALAVVVVDTLPAVGLLTLDGARVVAGQGVDAADLARGALVWTPPADAHGAALASIGFRVRDDGGTAGGGIDTDLQARTLRLDVTPVNDAPSGQDATLTLHEDTPRTLVAADFGMQDAADGDALSAIVVDMLPAVGRLTLDGMAVRTGQLVSAADLARGALVYAAPADAHGTALASLGFRVRDDGGTIGGGVDTDATRRTLRFDVRPVNDAPSGQDATLDVDEDTPRTLTAADFGFRDAADGDALSAVVIDTLPAAGHLTLDGRAVGVGQAVSATDLARGALVWTPPADAHGRALATIGWRVRDDGGTDRGGLDTAATTRTLTFDVTPVNDAPTGQDNTLRADEDRPRRLDAADFGFRDAADGDALSAVVIDTLPAAGHLTLDGRAVSAGQAVSAADLARGALVWTPPADAHGSAYAALTFRVRDDGGTMPGGYDTAAAASTLSFDLRAVADAPTATDATLALTEDRPRIVTAADLGFADAADGDALAALLLDALPRVGTLTLDGVPVGVGQAVSAADLARGALRYMPPPDAHGSALATITFRVRDSGGTVPGDADTSGAHTLRLDVQPVDDLPQVLQHTLVIAAGGDAVPLLPLRDPDTAPAALQAQVGSLQAGRFVDRAGAEVIRFTIAQLQQGDVRFQHDGSAVLPGYTLWIDDGVNPPLLTAPAVTLLAPTPATPPEVAPGPTPAVAPAPPPAPVPGPTAAIEPGPMPAVALEAPAADATSPLATSAADPTADASASDPAPTTLGRAGPAGTPWATDTTTPAPVVSRLSAGSGVTLDRPDVTTAVRLHRGAAPVVPTTGWTLTTRGTAATAMELTQGQLLHDIERLREQVESASQARLEALAASVALTGGLSIGYVVWLVRGGVLLGSMLSALPAWQMVDPLPVLSRARGLAGAVDDERDDPEDGVERMFGRHRRRATAPVSPPDRTGQAGPAVAADGPTAQPAAAPAAAPAEAPAREPETTA